MTPFFHHTVAFCLHFSFITFPTFFHSTFMPLDYYSILSNCRRIVQSLFCFRRRFMPACITIFTDKNKDHVFLHSPCLNNLYSIVNPFLSSSMHSVLMPHLPHNSPIHHQICFPFLPSPQRHLDLLLA